MFNPTALGMKNLFLCLLQNEKIYVKDRVTYLPTNWYALKVTDSEFALHSKLKAAHARVYLYWTYAVHRPVRILYALAISQVNGRCAYDWAAVIWPGDVEYDCTVVAHGRGPENWWFAFQRRSCIDTRALVRLMLSWRAWYGLTRVRRVSYTSR